MTETPGQIQMKPKELKHNPKLWGVVVLLFVLVGVALISRFPAEERQSSSSGIQSAKLSSGIHLLRLQGTGTYTNYNRDGTPHTNGAIGSVTFLTDFTNWTVAYASGNDPLKEEVTFLDAGCYHVTRNALVDHGPRRVDLATWTQGQHPGALFPSARLALTGAYLCGLLPNTQLDLAPPWIPVSPPVASAYAIEINAEKTEVNILTSSNRLAAAEKEEQKRRPRMSIPFVTQDTPADDFLRAQLRVLKTTTFRGDTVPMQVELKIFHTPAKTRIGRFKVRSPLLGYDVQTACSFQVTNISVCEGPIVPPVLPKPVQFSSGGSFFIITNGLWPDFIAAANQQARPEPGPKPGYVPLDLELPHPPTQLISWTPSDNSNTNLESFPPKLRPKFYVPPGVQNVSLGKNVSSSVNGLPAPALHRLADGQREPIETNVLILPGEYNGCSWTWGENTPCTRYFSGTIFATSRSSTMSLFRVPMILLSRKTCAPSSTTTTITPPVSGVAPTKNITKPTRANSSTHLEPRPVTSAFPATARLETPPTATWKSRFMVSP